MALCDDCQAVDLYSLWRAAQHGTMTSRKRNDFPTPRRIFKHSKKALVFSASSCDLCQSIKEGLEEGAQDTVVDDGNQIVRDEPVYLSILLGDSVSHGSTANPDERTIRRLDALTYTHEDESTVLGLFVVDSSCPDDSLLKTSVIQSRYLRRNGSLEICREWYEMCRKSHTDCGQSLLAPKGPARLVQVTSKGSSQTPFARVVMRASHTGEYATLSHCWGKPKFTVLNKSRLSEFMTAIPSTELTRTFQDALSITIALGLSYIWIDSLCIVQDDEKDWERESVKMGHIYAGAAVNIAASKAGDGSGGCLRNKDVNPSEPQLVVWDEQGTVLGSVIVGRTPSDFETSVLRGPLAVRSWVVQERLLARRQLYFSEGATYWQCDECFQSELGKEDDKLQADWKRGQELRKAVGLMSEIKETDLDDRHDLLAEVWNPMLEEYSLCQLSYGRDKFPALSGLASMVSGKMNVSYAAGLWQEFLPLQLLWEILFRGTGVRSKEWRAPSWSWASVDGGVRNMSQSSPHMTVLIRDWQVNVKLAGTDPFGRLTSASLAVTGPLKRAFCRKGELGWFIAEGNRIFGYVTLDDESEFREEVYCLAIVADHTRLGQRAHLRFTFVVLTRTSQENKFSRIGLGHSMHEVDFPPSEIRRIVIV